MTGSTIIQLSNVQYGPLHDLNLNIHTGERVMIFGPSGSGKSTLLHLMNRLVDPGAGSMTFYDNPYHSHSIPKLRRKIGLVLQSPHLFPGTVLENLKFGPSLANEWEKHRGEELLEYVQLPTEYLHRSVDQLSGGEQQRVSLARTLANKPDVLLLDEPTSALDEQTKEEIEDLLSSLIVKHNITMVMVTHQLNQAKRLGDRGIFLENGQIREEGPLPDLFEQPSTEELKSFLI